MKNLPLNKKRQGSIRQRRDIFKEPQYILYRPSGCELKIQVEDLHVIKRHFTVDRDEKVLRDEISE